MTKQVFFFIFKSQIMREIERFLTHYVLYSCLRTFLQLLVAVFLYQKSSKRVRFSQLTHLMSTVSFRTPETLDFRKISCIDGLKKTFVEAFSNLMCVVIFSGSKKY